MTNQEAFEKFWTLCNEALAARDQPEMLFGEAWRRWEGEYVGYGENSIDVYETL